MKLKILVATIAVLNLTCAYSAAEAELREHAKAQQASIQVLSAENLQEAYQDFLSYYTQNAKMQASGIQPAILFAQELHERDENKLAFKILGQSEFFDFKTVSQQDASIIDEILYRVPLQYIASLLENTAENPHQFWLQDSILRIYPKNETLFFLAKQAGSDDIEIRKKAVLDLFELMTVSEDIYFKRYAAQVIANTYDLNWKTFLDKSQDSQASMILTDAIIDPSVAIDQKISWAEDVDWKIHAVAAGIASEKGQAALDELMAIIQNPDVPQRKKNDAAHLVIVTHSHLEDKLIYLAPEEQRQAAYNIMLEGVDAGELSIHVLWAVSFDLEEHINKSESKPLASAEDRQRVLKAMMECIRKGRDWQKVEYARQLTYQNFGQNRDISTEVAETCLNLLESPYLAMEEKMQSTWHIINGSTFNNDGNVIANYSAASDEMRCKAIKKLLEMSESPGFSRFNLSHTCVSILEAKNSEGKFLATPGEIVKALDYGIDFLTNESFADDHKAWVAREIFELDNMQLTTEQFQMIFPYLLENIKDAYMDDYWTGKVARKILSYPVATEGQCKEALGIFLNRMNDEKKEKWYRQEYARVIVEAKDASNAPLATPVSCQQTCVTSSNDFSMVKKTLKDPPYYEQNHHRRCGRAI